MTEVISTPLAKREKQVMDALFRLGPSTVAEVRRSMLKAPSYSAVRSTLRILEQKGHVRHEHDANRYVFLPTRDPAKAQLSALDHVLETFFEGSIEKVMLTLIETKGAELSAGALRRIQDLIEKAGEEGR